jgi:hypothetical protein
VDDLLGLGRDVQDIENDTETIWRSSAGGTSECLDEENICTRLIECICRCLGLIAYSRHYMYLILKCGVLKIPGVNTVLRGKTLSERRQMTFSADGNTNVKAYSEMDARVFFKNRELCCTDLCFLLRIAV